MKVHGISTMAMSHYYLVSMIQENITDLIAKMGELSSSLIIYLRLFLPSSYTQPLVVPHIILFNNIIYASVLYFFSRVNWMYFLWFLTNLLWICLISLSTALTSSSPNIFITCLIFGWVRATYPRSASFGLINQQSIRNINQSDYL